MSEPIVLVHGSANGAYSWTSLLRVLKPAPGAVHAPDLIGYGASPPAGPTYGIADEVAHLRGYLAERGVDRFHLVTHSLGTMFGLHLRRALPDRITRLTLIDPVLEVALLRGAGEHAAYDEMAAAFERVLGALPDAAAAGRLFVDHWNGSGAWDALNGRTQAAIARLMPKVALEMTQAAHGVTTLAAVAAAPPVPTTILVGERTLLAPPAFTRVLAPALGARVVEVAGAGHVIPQSHPEAVARVLAEAA